MTQVQFSRRAQIVAVLSLVACGRTTVAEDKAPSTKPTIEFRDFPDVPGGKVSYSFVLTVEVEGADKKFRREYDVSGGFGGAATASLVEAELKQLPDWKYSVDGAKLVIEGWTDPKTKTFYPVKKIRFECPNLPMAHFPRVTYPGDKR